MTGLVSKAGPVDPISLALAERAEEVAEQEHRAMRAAYLRVELLELLDKPASLDVEYLVDLLRATWERMPQSLQQVRWCSPSTDDHAERFREVLAIGAAVADTFTVYAEAREDRHGKQENRNETAHG